MELSNALVSWLNSSPKIRQYIMQGNWSDLYAECYWDCPPSTTRQLTSALLEAGIDPLATITNNGNTRIPDAMMRRVSGVEVVNIPEGITVIGEHAFKRCADLKTIHLPNTLKEIEEAAFYGCEELHHIDLPESLISIANAAFEYSGLQSINWPGSVKTVPIKCFSGCNGLTKAVIEEGTTTIREFAFDGCVNLQHIYLPRSLATVALYGFPNAELHYAGTCKDWRTKVLCKGSIDKKYIIQCTDGEVEAWK